MKVVVFSDVHGNLPALEAMLAHEGGRAHAYVCLGDVVNYGPWSDACLERILALPDITLLEGNHEALFTGKEPISEEIELVRAFTRTALEHFTRYDLLSGLPTECELGSFLCAHTLDGRSIYADTEIELSRDCMIGHTHHQFEARRNGYRLVNPGSVGQNRGYIDEVCYVELDIETGTVAMKQTVYDVDGFIATLRAMHYPPECLTYYESKRRRYSRLDRSDR